MLKPMKCFIALIGVMILSTGVLLATASADEPAETDSETTTNCIMIHLINNIEVIDNQTILFHMKGNKIWKSTLPFPCQGLKFEGGISYTSSINKLCSGEIVTVTRRPDTTCTLGGFTLYEEESKEDME